MAHGHKMWFSAGSECYLDMTSGTWEPGVTALFEELLKPGMVAVDIGAHIGYFTLLAANKVGTTGKVYAFEPAPSNYAYLLRNIEINAYRNIIPIQKAVSNHEDGTTFFLHPDSVGHSIYPETLGKNRTAIKVNTTTLDSFFETEGWPSVHLVKMDIEGAEPAALDGMAILLERNKALYLILEYVPHILKRAGRNPRQFLERLRTLGFTISIIADKGVLHPFSEKDAARPGLRAELFCERDPSQLVHPRMRTLTPNQPIRRMPVEKQRNKQ
jgi:FkbM family methyltransferase